MQLTYLRDYVTYGWFYLALQPEKQLSTIMEVADRFTISRLRGKNSRISWA